MPSSVNDTCVLNQGDESLPEEIRWLCNTSNRSTHSSLAGRTWLEDVHDFYHRRGVLSVLQLRGIRNWRRGAPATETTGLQDLAAANQAILDEAAQINWNEWSIPEPEPEDQELSDRIDAENDDDEYDNDPALNYEGPHSVANRWPVGTSRRAATRTEATWVYNGMYKVYTPAGISFKFKIHTIVRTTNADMLHKRVISVFDEPNAMWQTFGFINVSGGVTLWRAWRDDDSEFLAEADHLVESFRLVDRTPSNWQWESRDIVASERTCRLCNGLTGAFSYVPSDVLGGAHDTCPAEVRAHRRASTPPRPARTARAFYVDDVVRESTLAPLAPVVRMNTEEQMIEVLSELGTGWLR